jgi:hypothetical protein
MASVEETFAAIEFQSVLPLFTALSAGFMAAVAVLIAEVLLKNALNKLRSYSLRIKE